MKQYRPSSRAQSTEFDPTLPGLDLALENLLAPAADCLEIGKTVVGEACARRWREAIRSVCLGDADDLYIAGPDRHPVPPERAHPFSPVPIHVENSQQEVWFFRLMLRIIRELVPSGRSEYRSCSSALWRGRQHRWRFQPDGDVKRSYVHKTSAAGLAGDLGCSVRVVDQLLRIARAARFVDVWQMPKKKAKPGQAGKIYGYAVFRWVQELPDKLLKQLRNKFHAPPPPWAAQPSVPDRRDAAPAPAQGAWSAEDDALVEGLRDGLLGRPKAPT